MPKIEMIVSDLDRTLLRTDRTISEYTKTVFKKCREAGLLLVFATARPERATKNWQLDCQPSYVIANNGATIVKDGKTIRNVCISEATKHSIIKRFVSEKSIAGICAEVGDFLYTNGTDYTGWDVDNGWNPVYNDYHAPVSESVCKFSVECRNANIVAGILRDYPELHMFPNNGEPWFQLTHKSTSKFEAVIYLSTLTGIPLQNIIAFGDDYNDTEMLEKCGIGVAVQNAAPEIKAAANHICDTNDNDGVAQYLEEFSL